MKISEIVKSSGVTISVDANEDREIKGITYDSRKVKNDFLFFAITGFKQDGNQYIQDAIDNGANVIIYDNESESSRELCRKQNVSLYFASDIRKTMALMSDAFYNSPSKKLKLIAVTGTNGKTTVTFILKAILEKAGFKSGLIGTISYVTGSSEDAANLTTPEAPEINEMMNQMVINGYTACVMETSSVALELDRVTGLDFDAGIFTNLTSEHLDYHQTMQKYFEAKKILFNNLKSEAIAVSNYDDSYGSAIVSATRARKIFYSMKMNSDYKISEYDLRLNGSSVSISHGGEVYKFESKLTGKFNLYNIAAAVTTAFEIGIGYEVIRNAVVNLEPVEGRFNFIQLPNKAYAVIDYSHTSDSLKNAIESAVDLVKETGTGGKVITVFGCGGNKDRNKRPVMGKHASELSDYVIVTSDNPRFEDPESIINEIFAGIKNRDKVERITDRESAIKRGIEITDEGDILLICGKGHETYQEINGVRNHFDDKEIVDKYKNLSGFSVLAG